jgi:hypothetical protein
VIVVHHFGLFLSVNDLDVDARFFPDTLDQLHTVLRITHGRSGTGPVVSHVIDLHQMAERLHQPNHVFLFLR